MITRTISKPYQVRSVVLITSCRLEVRRPENRGHAKTTRARIRLLLSTHPSFQRDVDVAMEQKQTTQANCALPAETKPIRHQLYYLDTMIIQVEGTLYKVPRHSLEKLSTAFQSAATLAQGDQLQEGSNDDNPIRLDGVKSIDFERLLRVIYPLQIGVPVVLRWDEWWSVLRLATMFDFESIRKLAIEKMSCDRVGRGDVDVILAARECGVREWLLPAYQALARRREMLSVADAERLGWEDGIAILQIRESFWVQAPPPDSRTTVTSHQTFGLSSAHARQTATTSPFSFGPSSLDSRNTAYSNPLFPGRPSPDSRNLADPGMVRKSEGDTLAAVKRVYGSEVTNPINDVDPVKRVLHAKLYKVNSWLQQAYVDLADRKDPTSVAEGKLLGWDTTVKMFRVRDEIKAQALSGSHSGGREGHDFEKAIKEKLGM
ncbi:hypothetical protein JAAARDRAFT_545472 [Jaapia argillacea MUCL 33604]|uniref:BTB domain-containing protein n=1 Tax=Jaapia argillacea MUCL 33604 TaxID=933084 RepID=A0A067P7K0_9AGAM|nr:hypothetical protein JAAARDRAFT_545472 [Jaapia argillacea MUCL 33604]